MMLEHEVLEWISASCLNATQSKAWLDLPFCKGLVVNAIIWHHASRLLSWTLVGYCASKLGWFTQRLSLN